MNQILQNKFRLKSLLAGYERNSIAIIAEGVANNRARRQILKDLKLELQKYAGLCRLRPDETAMFWNNSYKTLVRTSKKSWGKRNNPDVYAAIRQEVLYNREFTKIKNEIANRHEEMSKIDWIREMLDNSSSPFYLSDAHKDCAEGHKAYENRIYYDADWKERYGLDSETSKKVEKYIQSHRLMSVQEVVGEGIWFITRPNCKHRLQMIPLDTVLHGRRIPRIQAMVQNQDYPSGQRLYYYERSRILKQLNDTIPCLECQNDYKKTVRLMRKWSEK